MFSTSVPLPFEGAFIHGRCAAHILNLLAHEGLLVLKFTLCKLRTLIKHINAPKQKAVFEALVIELDKALVAEERLEKEKRPSLDVKTRYAFYFSIWKSCDFKNYFVSAIGIAPGKWSVSP
jgi:hypothetical protein